jgi:chemotaxis regulatin CheY-phosphate phosphatase CheZ
MLPTIEHSERFKTEYNNFKTRISDITDNDRLRSELTDKLNDLLKEVRYVDNQHMDILMAKQLTNIVEDTRSRMLELRQAIDRSLSNYEKSKQAIKG